MNTMKTALAIGLASAMATGLAFGASPQDSVKTEVSTAHTHAVYARQAPSVAVSHVHLHHVINCLVGPKGADFDAKQANPCKGQGNGALPDSANDQAMHAKLQTALNEAQTGLKSNDVKAVHSDAGKVAATLEAADPTANLKGSKGDSTTW